EKARRLPPPKHSCCSSARQSGENPQRRQVPSAVAPLGINTSTNKASEHEHAVVAVGIESVQLLCQGEGRCCTRTEKALEFQIGASGFHGNGLAVAGEVGVPGVEGPKGVGSFGIADGSLAKHTGGLHLLLLRALANTGGAVAHIIERAGKALGLVATQVVLRWIDL